MDLLFASLSPHTSPAVTPGLSSIRAVCLPEINAANPQELWKRFSYGSGSHEIMAATPADSKLTARLTPDLEDNFALVIALAKHDDPTKFFVHLNPTCSGVDSHGRPVQLSKNESTVLLENLRNATLPYQVEFAEYYKFDPSRCAEFPTQNPCWYDVGTNDLYDPGMVLVAPGAIPRTECYESHKRSMEDPMRRRNRLSKLMNRGQAWHPEKICPGWRTLCGSKRPPNLPQSYGAVGPKGGIWVQLPIERCDREEEDKRCVGQLGIRFGRLPPFDDPSMEWNHIDEDNLVCKSSTLNNILDRLANGTEFEDLDCPRCFRRNPVGPTVNAPRVNPEEGHRGTKWSLFWHIHRDYFSFMPHDTDLGQNYHEMPQRMDPLSKKKAFDFHLFPTVGYRPCGTHTHTHTHTVANASHANASHANASHAKITQAKITHAGVAGGSGSASSDGGQWGTKAAVAAALAMTTRAIAN